MKSRLSLIRHRSHHQDHQYNHKMTRSSRRQPIPAIQSVRERSPNMAALEDRAPFSDVSVVGNLRGIEHLPRWAQWMVRFIYFRYGWAALAKKDGVYYSVELRGVTPSQAEARYFASEPNGFCMRAPWRTFLSTELGQYATQDHPLSRVSPDYRNRKLPYVAISREDLERLGRKIEQTVKCAEGRCTSAKVV
jgi:hypothetical protein